jgi:hypothetical protein
LKQAALLFPITGSWTAPPANTFCISMPTAETAKSAAFAVKFCKASVRAAEPLSAARFVKNKGCLSKKQPFSPAFMPENY